MENRQDPPEDQRMQCITIRNSVVVSKNNMQVMLRDGVEELFIVDFDAIFRNRFNFKIYQDVSMYFEITVMSLPLRIEDIMDSFISGASRIVIPGRLEATALEDYMKTSESLVMLFQNPVVANAFYALGGRAFLTDRELGFPQATIYSFSRILRKPGYIELIDFPRDELETVLS